MDKIPKEYIFKKQWFEYMGYKPHDGQCKMHYPENLNASFFVNICGRRYGKTTAAFREAQFVAAQPNKKIWLVGLSYKKSRLMFREVYKDMVKGHKKDIVAASEKEQYIRFSWGTTVEGMSADNPSSLLGEGLDLVIIDEASRMPRKIWDLYLSPTLSDRKGKAIFITTPNGYNWIYDLYLLGKTDPKWYSTQSPSWENHHAFPDGLKDEFLMERMRNMSKELFDQEYGAQFASFAGKVYPFERGLDVKKVEYQPHLPTYCTIDFGYRMPAALFIQTYRKDGLWYINVIDEIIHEKNVSTDEFARRILSKKYHILTYYGDPAGYNVQGQTGMGDIEIFKNSGINVRFRTDKASRNIASSVSYVRGFFKSAAGDRRITVSERCKGIIEDFENYRYPEEVEGKSLSNDPIKDGYYEHGCDAFRYFITNRFPMVNNQLIRIAR
jgi:hypothetical protein